MLRVKSLFMRCLLFVVMVVANSLIVNAQSTVYVFNHSTNCFGDGGESTLTLNGVQNFDLRGPLKRVMANVGNPSLPLHIYKSSKKKLILKEEGKVLLGFKYKFVTGSGKESDLTAEIQLNLSEGSVHYLKIQPKGLNDVQFKEITEKEGLKLMKDKKYVELSDYIEE